MVYLISTSVTRLDEIHHAALLRVARSESEACEIGLAYVEEIRPRSDEWSDYHVLAAEIKVETLQYLIDEARALTR